MRSTGRLSVLAILAFVAGAGNGFATTEAGRPALSPPVVPLVENKGQYDPAVAFYARTGSGAAFVTTEGQIVYSISAMRGPMQSGGWTLTENFVDGHASPAGAEASATRVSSFSGSDPAKWATDARTFRTVNLGQVYPGIDVSLRSDGRELEKIFTVQPAGGLERIRLHVAGAQSLAVNADGELVVATGLGDVRWSRPVAWQDIDGLRRDVDARYRIEGLEYGFLVGDHDPKHALVIDPAITTSFIGGPSAGSEIALDVVRNPADGDIFVTGDANGVGFPGTAGGAQPAYNNGGDSFVARFNSNLSILEQATYFGGSGGDSALAITIHPVTGDVYITGYTNSASLPGIAGAALNVNLGYGGFVAAFDPSLTSLVRSTFYGGDSGDQPFDIAVHPISGDIYIVGETGGTFLPSTAGAAQTVKAGSMDAFVAVLSADLTVIGRSTFLGGTETSLERARRLSIDPVSGDVFVFGETSAPDFPGRAGGAQSVYAGFGDAFVARFNQGLTTLEQSTYLGGSTGEGLVTGTRHPASGNIYVSGDTGSPDFPGVPPNTSGPFVTRMNAALTSFTNSILIPGGNGNGSQTVEVDSATGDVFVAGEGSSYTATAGSPQPNPGGGLGDGWISRYDETLATLKMGTHLGGSNAGSSDALFAIAPHGATGAVYAVGYSASVDFPGLAFGAQGTFGGGPNDAFVSRVVVPKPKPVCSDDPVSGCLGPVDVADSGVTVGGDPDAKSLQWKWRRGEATSKAEFGDPAFADNYLLCVYDGTSTLISETVIPAGGACNLSSRPTACWRENAKGFKYKDRDGTNGGVQNLKLMEGDAGKAQVQLKARGTNVDAPATFPLGQPVTVQLRSDAGSVCWEAVYSAPAALNTDTPRKRFKDTSD